MQKSALGSILDNASVPFSSSPLTRPTTQARSLHQGLQGQTRGAERMLLEND